jgi:hypothetical protein
MGDDLENILKFTPMILKTQRPTLQRLADG